MEMELQYMVLLILCKSSEMLSVNNSRGIIQETGLRIATVGETVTLRCSCQSDAVTLLLWYQQRLDGKPQVISELINQATKATIYPAYEKRFQIVSKYEGCINNLIITNLLPSDSGTYYCVILKYTVIEFGEGVFLHVKTSLSNTKLSIHPPKLKVLQLGLSINLTCSAYAASCQTEPKLYWFRLGALLPAHLYPSERQCTSIRNGKFEGKYCISNLQLTSVTPSDAGTYHCALSACGKAVFHEGTKVEVIANTAPSIQVYCLSIVLGLSIIWVFVLSLLMYKLKLKLFSVCKGVGAHRRFSLGTTDVQKDDPGSLHYSTVNFKGRSPQLQQDTDGACVYSGVKTRKQ